MIVVVSSRGPHLEDEVSPIFGRSPYFLLVDSETMVAQDMLNPAVSASGGAGVQSSQMLVRQGVEAVIGGNVGPNAMAVFTAAGIPVYHAAGRTVQQAVEALRDSVLERLDGPTVAKDHGKSGGTFAGRGMGRGQGMGSGRRMGQGA
jgi:predicted Fe-Mo cluster-binding NifX family protein